MAVNAASGNPEQVYPSGPGGATAPTTAGPDPGTGDGDGDASPPPHPRTTRHHHTHHHHNTTHHPTTTNPQPGQSRLSHGGVGIAVGGAVAQRGRTCSMVCPRPGMGWSWHNHGREDSVKLTRLSLTSPRTGENTLMDNVR